MAFIAAYNSQHIFSKGVLMVHDLDGLIWGYPTFDGVQLFGEHESDESSECGTKIARSY